MKLQKEKAIDRRIDRRPIVKNCPAVCFPGGIGIARRDRGKAVYVPIATQLTATAAAPAIGVTSPDAVGFQTFKMTEPAAGVPA